MPLTISVTLHHQLSSFSLPLAMTLFRWKMDNATSSWRVSQNRSPGMTTATMNSMRKPVLIVLPGSVRRLDWHSPRRRYWTFWDRCHLRFHCRDGECCEVTVTHLPGFVPIAYSCRHLS